MAASVWYAAFIASGAGRVDGKVAFPLFDDAMISMTYARNLADGNGLVWNAGGERVEGITNLAWTGFMAVPHALGVPDAKVGLVVAVTGALLCLASGWLARAVVAQLAPQRPGAATAAAWLVCFYYPLVYWSLRGMEVGLLAALLLAAVLLALRLSAPDDASGHTRRDTVLLAGALALGLLTRMDFAVFAGVIIAYLLWTGPRRVAVAVGGAAGVAVVAQELFRHAYYGAWVPNTYALKLVGAPLGDRLDRGLRSVGLTALASIGALALAAIGTAVLSRRGTRGPWLLVGCAALAAAYGAYVGGDAWEWMRYANRYLTPAVVLVLCLAAVGIHELADRHDRRAVHAGAGVAVGVAALLLLFDPGGDVLFNHHPYPAEAVPRAVALVPLAVVLVAGSAIVANRGRSAWAGAMTVALVVALGAAPFARWVAQGPIYGPEDLQLARLGAEVAGYTEPGATIAVVAAGNIVYFARRPAVDLLGKSERVIAEGPMRPEVGFYPGHMKWDHAYSFGQRRPDVIVDTWRIDCGERQLLVDLGYLIARPAGGGVRGDDVVLVLGGSPHVQFDELEVWTPADTADVLLEPC